MFFSCPCVVYYPTNVLVSGRKFKSSGFWRRQTTSFFYQSQPSPLAEASEDIQRIFLFFFAFMSFCLGCAIKTQQALLRRSDGSPSSSVRRLQSRPASLQSEDVQGVFLFFRRLHVSFLECEIKTQLNQYSQHVIDAHK